jgi:hypothetical protein
MFPSKIICRLFRQALEEADTLYEGYSWSSIAKRKIIQGAYLALFILQ